MTITSTPGKKSLWTSGIIGVAVKDSFVKLNPRTLMKNPVMFVVEVGSVVTSVELINDLLRHNGNFGFELQITLWLWFTVLFANFAEAMAEARGKAQAETLRKTKTDSIAKRLGADGSHESVPASKLRKGDVVFCEASDT